MGQTESQELQPPWELVVNVMKFMPWEELQNVFCLNQYFHSLLNRPETYRTLCSILRDEFHIYVPPNPWNSSWKLTLNHLHSLRKFSPTYIQSTPTATTASTATEPEVHQFAVRVCARFRDGGASDDQPLQSATIPIHQRLDMLKAQHQCSRSEALRLLWGTTESDPWRSAFVPDLETDANAEDKENACAQIQAPKSPPRGPIADAHARVGVLSMRPQQVVVCAPTLGVRSFRFERVFSPAAGQEEVYEQAAQHVAADFVNGFNGCVFCYGQTGSGKTFTMFGPGEQESTSLRISPTSGIAPRMLAEIIEGVRVRARAADIMLSVAYVEVFGNDINDLLREGAAVGPWHGMAVRHVLSGNTSVRVSTAADIEELLERGERNKRRAATAMNERSSRAHSVIMVTLQQTQRGGRVLRSRLCIADLGGSEQIKKSGVEGRQCDQKKIAKCL